MPTYEYQCEECGELFEVRQKFSDEPLTVHEKCNGKAHRLISVPALQFKGSGFYITDYAKGSAPGAKDNGSSSANSSPEGSKTASSGDSKASTASSESKPAASTTSSSNKKSSE